MNFTKPQKAVATVGACLSLGAVAGIAGSAAAPSKTKHKSSAPTRAHRFGGPGRMFGFHGPAVHETSVVLNKKGDGFITATEDSGTVKSVSGSDVTITEGFGKVTYKDVSVTIPSGATVYRNGAKAAVGDLAAGDMIHVSSSSEGTAVFAFDAKHKPAFGRGGRFRHDGRGPGGPQGLRGAPAPGGYGAPPPAPPAA